MEVTQAQLEQLVAKQVEVQLADRRVSSMPRELLEFKRSIKQFATSKEDTGVNYATITSAINTLLRVKFNLKNINNLPMSKIDEARNFVSQLQQLL